MITYECGPVWDKRIVTINPASKVGICMSGGVDSYVLYHLLKKQTNPLVFNIYRNDGHDNSNHLSKLIDDDIIVIPQLSENSLHRINGGFDYIMDNYDIDELYGGANQVPPLHQFPEFNTPAMPTRYFNLKYRKIVVPFNSLYKYHILDLADRNNIDLTMTYSCLRNMPPQPECGECWQCKEKKWAYEQKNAF